MSKYEMDMQGDKPKQRNPKKTCRTCIHNEVCVYIWAFSFEGTQSRKELAKDADLDLPRWNCGNWADLFKIVAGMWRKR